MLNLWFDDPRSPILLKSSLPKPWRRCPSTKLQALSSKPIRRRRLTFSLLRERVYPSKSSKSDPDLTLPALLLRMLVSVQHDLTMRRFYGCVVLMDYILSLNLLGDHSVQVKLNGAHVQGSPFLVKAYNADQVKVTDINSGVVGKPVFFSSEYIF